LSDDDRLKLKALAPKADIAVVPCPFISTGWSEDKATSKRALAFSPSERHVVVAGRLVSVGGTEQKGVSVAIHAVSTLPKWRLHVLGDGPFRQELERLAERLGVASRVSFHGRLRRELALRYMNAADVVAMPSLYEPFGMVWLEAIAVGTPVVATQVGGPKEYLHSGRDCLLVPPGDVEALASALRQLGESPLLAESLALSAAQRLQTDFSAQAVVERIRSVLRDRGMWKSDEEVLDACGH
jgi:glycogen(starch) synthase